jgi:hypothetical protein
MNERRKCVKGRESWLRGVHECEMGESWMREESVEGRESGMRGQCIKG